MGRSTYSTPRTVCGIVSRMETNTYRLTTRPAGTAFVAHDCKRCDAPELKRPVFVTDGNGIIAVGTRCAAILLGLVEPGTTARAAEKALAAHRHAAARAAEKAEDDRWEAFLTETGMTPGLPAMAAYREWTPAA